MTNLHALSFTVLWLLGGGSGESHPQAGTSARSASVVFEVRLAFKEPGTDRTAVAVPGLTPPERLYVANEVVVTEQHLRSIEVSLEPAKRGLLLEFSAEGTRRLALATRTHAGQHMAVYLDGVLQSMPYLQEPIVDGRVWMYGGRYSDSELRDLDRRLREALMR